MFRKLGLLCAALAIFSIAGGHWAVLQSVAWAGMLRDYSVSSGSIAIALEQTFDGQHPCNLCKDITAAKSKESKHTPANQNLTNGAEIKAVVADHPLPTRDRAAADVHFAPDASSAGPARFDSPPTPPPRSPIFAA